MSPTPVLSLGASGIDINIVWMILNSISQVYCSDFCSIICECEGMNKGRERTERGRESEEETSASASILHKCGAEDL